MLTLTLKPGESVTIGDYAVITLQEKSGNAARLSVKADKSIPIKKTEATTEAHLAARFGLGPSVV